MNGTLVFVLCIVAIYYAAETVRHVIKSRTERKIDDAGLEEYSARIDELEERIRVLERIVTEDKRDLRREINRL